MEEYSEQSILKILKDEGEPGMRFLFKQYHNYMCHAVYRIIPDQILVEDIVQEVFYEIWKKKEDLDVQISLKAYLRRASINKALNYIRDHKIQFDEEDKIHELNLASQPSGIQNLESEELEKLLHVAIDELPPKCRVVFMMSRFEEMTYREIADSLSISVKTVENQISKALKILRNALNPYFQKS